MFGHIVGLERICGEDIEGPCPQFMIGECGVGYDSLNSGLLSKVWYHLPPFVLEVLVSVMDGPRPLGFLEESTYAFMRSLSGKSVDSLLICPHPPCSAEITRLEMAGAHGDAKYTIGAKYTQTPSLTGSSDLIAWALLERFGQAKGEVAYPLFVKKWRD